MSHVSLVQGPQAGEQRRPRLVSAHKVGLGLADGLIKDTYEVLSPLHRLHEASGTAASQIGACPGFSGRVLFRRRSHSYCLRAWMAGK